MLNTAADDELIRRNPCRIKGAGVEHPAERPVLTLSEVMALTDAIDRRYRMLVLLAVFASLRWGELMGLRKTDFDLDFAWSRSSGRWSLVGVRQLIKQPKTPAGVRTVALRMWLLPDLERHFSDYSEQTSDGRVFVGPKGVMPARRTSPPSGLGPWRRPHDRHPFHDLRHAGNHFAAVSGASTRELMAHAARQLNAALVYQHRTASRDPAIADSLDAMVAALKAEGSDGSGHVGGTATG